MIAEVKRYGPPIAALTLIVFAIGASMVATRIQNYHSFAFFALVTFVLTCYAFVISSTALSDPYGGKIADVSCFFGTLCMFLAILFVGLAMVAVNLMGLPTRLTLLSLWPLSLVIVGAIITALFAGATISLLRAGPNTPKPNGNSTT